MRRINRIIIASTIFLTACAADTSESDEDARPNALADVNATIAAVKAEATRVEGERKYKAQVAVVVEEKRAAEAERKRIAEAKRVADVKRKQALEAKAKLAKTIASKPIQPSRSSAYVGKAQAYEATFYTAFCPTGCTGVTASGYDVSSTIYYDGMRILAAPKYIPLYSIMRVKLANGTSFDGIVLDRGGNIGTGRLDILVKTRQEAYAHGRQSVEVRLIRKGR